MQDWPCDDLYGMIINNVDECDYFFSFLLEKSIQYMYKSHTMYNFHDITDIFAIFYPSKGANSPPPFLIKPALVQNSNKPPLLAFLELFGGKI